jgi:hypothetical protein
LGDREIVPLPGMQAIVVNTKKNSPTRYIFLLPITSDIEPERSKVHPQAREPTEAGQSRRFPEILISRAIVGRLTMRIPPSMAVTRLRQDIEPMMTVALHVDIDSVFVPVKDSDDSIGCSGGTSVFL